MGKQAGYKFTKSNDQFSYRFTSVGSKGEIQKIVVLSPAIGTAWNLAFGDANGEGDDFDDEAISNNGDMKAVLQTLANIIYDFLSENPDFEIIIHPVDDRRQTLYNQIIHRNFDLITSELDLIGVVNNYPEPIRLPHLRIMTCS